MHDGAPGERWVRHDAPSEAARRSRPSELENPVLSPMEKRSEVEAEMKARLGLAVIRWKATRQHAPTLVACLILCALGASWSGSFAQSANPSIEEWDAVEAGLVSFLGRGDPNLRQPPAIQIVSPPMDLDHVDTDGVRRILIETADTVPQWGPYFRPSGRTVRKEYEAFLGSMEPSRSAPGSPASSALAGSPPFQFSPDLAELAKQGTALLQPEGVRWEVMASSNSKNARNSVKKIRLRIGRLDIRGGASGKQQDLDSQIAEGVFTCTGMSIVNIIPGEWFSSQLLERFAKGPFKAAKGAEYWWGPKGQFPMYPRGIVVVSDPSFSLRLDAQSYRQLKTAWVAGISIEVGLFQMNASSGKSSLTFDEKSLTVVARQSSRAMIVGVVNQINNLP
jgi:hypothetical protein